MDTWQYHEALLPVEPHKSIFPHMILISEANILFWRRQCMTMERYERVAFDLVAGECTGIDARQKQSRVHISIKRTFRENRRW